MPHQHVLDPGGLKLTTTQEFDFQGKAVTITDPRQFVSLVDRDGLGRALTTTHYLDRAKQVSVKELQTYNAFNQVKTQTNKNQAVSTHDYDLTKRQHVLTTPEKRTVTTVSNVFGEATSVADNAGHTHSFHHEPGGEVDVETDPLKREKSDVFNVMGWHTDHSHWGGLKTKYQQDDAGFQQQDTDAVDTSLAVSQDYTVNSKGQEVTKTDALQVITTTDRDRRGLATMVTVDPQTKANTMRDRKSVV